MKINPKKCKGIGRAKGFEGACGQVVTVRTYGLCKKCFVEWLLTTSNGAYVLKSSQLTGKKRVKKEFDKKQKQSTECMRDNVTDYKNKLQLRINEISRRIDKGQPCLATRRTFYKMDAGHVYSRGANQNIKFNLHNIHRQSAQSNHFQSDDHKMREGLIREYGKNYSEFVYELKQTDVLKYTKPEYKMFYERALAICHVLRKLDAYYTKNERLSLRNKYNVELGLYQNKFSVFNY